VGVGIVAGGVFLFLLCGFCVGLCSDLVLVLGWCCVSLCVFIVKVCCLWFMGAWVWCGLMLWKRLSCLFCGIAVCKLVVIAGVLLWVCVGGCVMLGVFYLVVCVFHVFFTL